MDPVIRRIRPDELPAFRRSVMVPFLDAFTGEPDQLADHARWLAKAEPERTWVVDTGEGFVGNACIYSLDVTLPAGPDRACPTIPMAGVSAVGVHPTHRRKGFLGQLIRAMHDDARSRGEAVCGLEASESVIYGRFGYGLAANLAEYSIDTRSSAFDIPAPALELRLIDRDEATKVLPGLFDLQRRTRAGEVDRNAAVWAQLLDDPPAERHGATGLFHSAGDGGYVTYRARTDADPFRAERTTIQVEELRGRTPDIEAALWRFVLDLDLVGRVVAKRRPVDEPLRWRLADPRQLRTTAIEDRLYVRILDPAAAFEGRGYQSEGRLVLDVLEPAASEGEVDGTPGRWVLEAGPDGASCRRARTGEGPDLRLGVPALGSLFLGGFPASNLAAGGRIEELAPGALAAADALLTTWPSPRSGTGF